MRSQATGHLFYSHTNFLRIDDRGSHRLDTLVGGDVASSIHTATIPDLTSLNVLSYSQDIARDDALALLDHSRIKKAHIDGLTMGGFATFSLSPIYKNLGTKRPQSCLSKAPLNCR